MKNKRKKENNESFNKGMNNVLFIILIGYIIFIY